MKSKYWILITCLVVIGVLIYLIVGISNELSENSYKNNNSPSYQKTDNVTTNTPNTTYNQQVENSSITSQSATQIFYDKLIESNKVTANDIGDYTSFSNAIKNNGIDDVKRLYKLLKSKGLTENEIGNLNDFLTRIENLRINETTTPEQQKNDKINDNTSSYSNTTDSPYKGNQLTNGSSPLNACFGKGVYSGNATLTIKNGSSSDAIVCLYSVSRGRTIRNEYVQKNTNFKISNIGQGYYKIRVLYGNDWNPTLENHCGSKGNFETDVSFSEFDGEQYFEDNENGYTIATVTLYTVSGGNARTSSISQSEFFNR